ncbi:protein translocase subunit SecF [bacterium]|nr:protein translocase subunit SecF [bacterium]
MNVIGRRRLWFAISLLVIIPGTISLFIWGLRPGIDFAGGQSMEIAGTQDQQFVRDTLASVGARDIVITTTGTDKLLARYRDEEGKDSTVTSNEIKTKLATQNAQPTNFESIGPAVSRDITRNAFVSVGLASLAIVFFIAFAFRNTPPPVSPWSFGVTAVIALLHDTLVIVGIFSLLGRFANVEIDSLFVTAVLTAIGFSVHDTIVVYDRIRENLKRSSESFEVVVNDSIVETMARSLGTSLTVIFTLLALLIFGGETIRLFIFALLVGIMSGTYSSIFNAAPMLVVWHNFKFKRRAAKKLKKT